jgi:hypothetical protein
VSVKVKSWRAVDHRGADLILDRHARRFGRQQRGLLRPCARDLVHEVDDDGDGGRAHKRGCARRKQRQQVEVGLHLPERRRRLRERVEERLQLGGHRRGPGCVRRPVERHRHVARVLRDDRVVEGERVVPALDVVQRRRLGHRMRRRALTVDGRRHGAAQTRIGIWSVPIWAACCSAALGSSSKVSHDELSWSSMLGYAVTELEYGIAPVSDVANGLLRGPRRRP